MKLVNYFNLMVIMAAALFTWQAVAHAAEPMHVHVMQNLSTSEAKDLNEALVHLGYQPSGKTIFSESHNAIIVTKALKNEHESASITIELVKFDSDREMPRTLFEYRLGGNDIHAVIKAFPRPEAFSDESIMPAVASNSQLPE